MPMSEATLAEKALIDWTTDDDLLFYERPPREACSLCSDTVGTAADASSVNVMVRLQCCAAAVCRRCISNGLLPLYSACCPFCEKKLAPIDRIAGCTHDEDWIAMEKQEFFQNLLRDGFEGFRCTSESCVKGCLARAQNPQAALVRSATCPTVQDAAAAGLQMETMSVRTWWHRDRGKKTESSNFAQGAFIPRSYSQVATSSDVP